MLRFAIRRFAGILLPLLILAGLALAVAAPDAGAAAGRALGGLPVTAAVLAAVLALGYGVGVPLGLAAAMPADGRPGTGGWLAGRVGQGLAALSGGLPGFLAVAAGVALVGGAKLAPVTPVGVLLLVFAPMAESARLARNALAAQRESGAILAARGRGLGEGEALARHARPAALAAALATLGPVGTAMICGAVAAESLFGFPGCGAVLVGALHAGDGATAALAAAVLAGLALVLHAGGAVLAAWADPRRRSR